MTDPLNSAPVVALDDLAQQVVVRLRGQPAFDRAMYGISEAANHSVLWHSINLIDGLLGDSERRRRALRRSVILAVEQSIVNGPVKLMVKRRRPATPPAHPYRLRNPRTSSFPSGHASAGACAATLLSQDLGGGPLWWALAGVVSWSRIHVGVHHMSDVLGGVVVGRVLGGAAGIFWPVR